MNALGIIPYFFSIIFLEALVDGYAYLAWTKRIKKYGIWEHIFQLVLFAQLIAFGALFFRQFDFFSFETFIGFVGYVLMRYAYFDLFRTWITKQYIPGKISLFDQLTSKFPILNNVLLRLIIGFVGVCLIVKYL